MENALERINNLENKVNILTLDMNSIKKDFTKIKDNLELLVNKLVKDPESNKSDINNEDISNSNIQESFADASGNLNSERNPFINAQKNLENSQSYSIVSEANKKKRKI